MEPVQTRHYPSRAPSARFRGVPVHRLALRRHCARYSHISRRTPPPSYRLPCFPNSVNPQLLLRSNDASPAPILPRPGSYQPIDRAWLVVLSTTVHYPEGDNASNRRGGTRQKRRKGFGFHILSAIGGYHVSPCLTFLASWNLRRCKAPDSTGCCCPEAGPKNKLG